MNITDLVELLDASPVLVRRVNNVKSADLEQVVVGFDCTVSTGINVTVNSDQISNVVKFCFVKVNELFYLYIGVKVNDNIVKYSKYLISDLLNINL